MQEPPSTKREASGPAPRKTLLQYELLEKIGEGGMGEVYRARDTRLERSVAIKLLAADIAGDAERIRRFQQEARAASALNHPHIVAIHDTGQADSTHFIAMELVDGQPLGIWLQRDKPELRRVLEVMTQVADALAAAHEAGIAHRDVKPGNLLVTRQGYAKVVDFGLAKLVEAAGPGGEATRTAGSAPSQAGGAAGTIPYMSPEQALGRAVDARTDIFSLGTVLYEAVTGRRPFTGGNQVDVLHAIVHAQPEAVRKWRPALPPELQWVVDKALAKDLDERYQTMAEFAADLRRLRRRMESGSASQLEAQVAAPRRARPWWVHTGAGALFALAAVLLLWAIPAVRERLAPQPVSALEAITLNPLTIDPGYEGEPSFSPDGETIAYVSDRTGNFEIFLKQVSGGSEINLTNNPADEAQPAFSPDGKQIAFVSTRAAGTRLEWYSPDSPLMGGDIWVMPALGGNARRITAGGNFPSWTPDGSAIVFASGPWFDQKIYRVASSGGEPEQIPVRFRPGFTPPRLLYPRASPGGRWIVFQAQAAIYIVSIQGGEARPIARGICPQWGPDSASVVYSSGEPGKNYSLWRARFSSADGKVTGKPEPLTVGRGRDMQPTLSRDGKRIAFSALDVSFNLETMPLDAETGKQGGESQALTKGRDVTFFMNFSPDGRSVVFESRRGTSWTIWRKDLGSGPAPLTSDPKFEDLYPRWSPDGQTIAFTRRPAGASEAQTSTWLMSSDGANLRVLIDQAGYSAWMPDGKAVVYVDPASRQLRLTELASKTTRPLTSEPRVMPIFAVSPDGKWVVYQSTMSGNVDLRAAPTDGGPSRVVVATPNQDYHPSFSPSGKWLYFQQSHQNLYRVPGPAEGWRQAPPEKITNFSESGVFLEDPQFSRDGRQLLYSRGLITGDIWLLNLGK